MSGVIVGRECVFSAYFASMSSSRLAYMMAIRVSIATHNKTDGLVLMAVVHIHGQLGQV